MLNDIKEISLKDLEDAIKEVGLPEYPKYIGNGLWKLSDNCITGDKGLEAFDKAVLEQIKKDYENCVNDPSMVKVVDVNGMSISFFPDSSDANKKEEK